MTTPAQLARAMHTVIEPAHAIAYFAPQQAQRWEALGLDPRSQGYFAGRAAPLGAVGAGVVTAVFHNFAPAVVAAMVPAVWDGATPAQVLQARAAGMESTYEELDVPGEVVAEATELARRAADGLDVAARPLAAANVELERAGGPFAQLWQALTVLREHRGDGHVALLVTAGLAPVEALVLYAGWQEGISRRFLQATRGWGDDAWQAGTDGLVARGWADADGLTVAGRAARTDLEDRTDDLAAAPWRHLGADDTRRLWDLLQPVAVATAAGFPRPPTVPDAFPA